LSFRHIKPEIKTPYGVEHPHSNRHERAPNQGQNGFCKTNPIWNLFLGFNPPYLSMQKNEKRVDFFINV
jgi:hypothetical protein